MSTTYRISDPTVVREYLDARQALRKWRRAASAYADQFPGAEGYLRSFMGGDEATLVLKPTHPGHPPETIPDGWRYVKTRDSIEPKLYAAGEAARAEFAPFRTSPAKPTKVLSNHGVPTIILDADRSMFYGVQHFHHDGALYLRYGADAIGERIPAIMEPIKESAFHLAHEAMVEAQEATQ